MGATRTFRGNFIGANIEALRKSVKEVIEKYHNHDWVLIENDKAHPYEIKVVISSKQSYRDQIAIFGGVMFDIGRLYEKYNQ